MDGPVPCPPCPSEAPGKGSTSGQCVQPQIVAEVVECVSHSKAKSLLWLLTDPGTGTGPMVSSLGSSSPKMMDEGKVSSAV